MSMPKIRGLLFDLDGTLVDTAAANVAAYRSALEEAGVQVEEGVLELTSPGRNWRQFLPPIIDRAGAAIDPAVVADRKKVIYREMVATLRLNDDLLALLATFRRDVRTALVTTASRDNVDALLDAHRLRDFFDVVVTGDDVDRHKPDPEAYLRAVERLGVESGACLAFEDSDIGEASARAAGLFAIRVSMSYRSSREDTSHRRGQVPLPSGDSLAPIGPLGRGGD